MKHSKIKGIIFDCDGTLVDSEEFHFLAWQKTLQPHGYFLEKKFYIEHFAGKGEIAVAKTAIELLGFGHPQEFIENKNKHFDAYQQAGIPPIPSTVEFATRLFKLKDQYSLKLAVASGARKEEILCHLQRLNIEHYFDSILSGHDDLAEYQDDEGKNKPKPYVYLKTAKFLGLQPEECVAIEDSRIGVASAVNAGCFTIAIPNSFTELNDLSQAHMKIASFANLSVEDFLMQILQEIKRLPSNEFNSYNLAPFTLEGDDVNREGRVL